MITPLNIAFVNDGEQGLVSKVVNYIIDFFFLLDIIIIFNSAYYTVDSDLVTDRKEIAYSYITGWFLVDLFAIIPFDQILNATNFNEFVRMARFGRLYKLVKLTRLVRILKILKEKSKLMKYLNEFLKISLGFERMFFFVLVFLILTHICSCLWIIIASLY